MCKRCESFGKELHGVSNGRYKAWRCNLNAYQKEKDFPSHLVLLSLPDPSRTWHSEGVSDDIRFLCINPLRPVINGGLLTGTLTGMSRLKEACVGSGHHQEALRNWD